MKLTRSVSNFSFKSKKQSLIQTTTYKRALVFWKISEEVWKTKERNSYQYNFFSFPSLYFIGHNQQLYQLCFAALKDRRLYFRNIEILTSVLGSTMQLIAKPLELAECFFSYLLLSFLHAHPTSEQKLYSDTNTFITLYPF